MAGTLLVTLEVLLTNLHNAVCQYIQTEQDICDLFSSGFTCPFVPVLPVMCILINTYLLINLGGDTWMRVGIWLLMGVLVYIFYGRTHSSLTDVVYVPVAQADEIYRSSSGYVS
jgi:hypothetical protein